MARVLNIQIFADGIWRDAAVWTIDDPAIGWRGPSRVDYVLDYCLFSDPNMTGDVRGIKALSVRLPPDQGWHPTANWPPFLLDLLPQGHVRKVLAEALDLNQDAPWADEPLLLQTAGSPIGNLRVREAWEWEQSRISGFRPDGITDAQLFAKDDHFAELAADAAAVASGSSGVQGAWPKMLLTRDRRGRWLPDPMVPDDQATDHIIAKWVGDDAERTRLILQAEAPYLELARAFGLRCALPLRYQNGMLLIPRFDRRIENGKVVRCGQESILSAAGIAGFGHVTDHEVYLATLKCRCDDPAREVTEYVLRDLLNLAAGNSDNHGRNTALAKDVDGSVRLTPLYDFCPMRLDPTGIARSTRWACMRSPSGASGDLNPDWDLVCAAAADGIMDADVLREQIAAKSEDVRRLPDAARALGVPDQVIDLAMGRCDELARGAERRSRTMSHASL